jgi:hypothetical protein
MLSGPRPTANASAAPAYIPFPVEALPDPLRRYIVEADRAIGCDPTFVALPLLSAVGAVIGNSTAILLKSCWVEPAILWTAVVCESGSAKTPALKAALKPIRKLEALARRIHDREIEEWNREVLLYEKRLAEWKKDGKGPDAHPPVPPKRPIARRFVVNDTTTEALLGILTDNPRGVLVARDELSGLVGSFDRYAKGGKGGGDAAAWLPMHSGEPVTIDRKTGIPPTLHVPAAFVGVTGGIQPGVLKRAFGIEHRENGLLARFMVAYPPQRLRRWTEAVIAEETEDAIERLFAGLLSLKPRLDKDGEETPRLVCFDPEAKRVWVAFYDEHHRELLSHHGDAAAAWSKLVGGAARLTLIIHLVRVVAGDPAIVDPNIVDAASVEAGVRLARWFAAEALRVYELLAESDSDREARALAEWIVRQGNDLTAAEVSRGVWRFRGDAEAAELALADLAARGYGHWIDCPAGGKGGRPTRRFRFNPGASPQRNPLIPGESEGSVEVSNRSDPAGDDAPPVGRWADGTPIIPPAGMDADDGWGQV